ncbi:hypothetical protein DYB25_011867 [Aphanomyces astaci]|uniref:OPT family oligopeptide transporter n=1 Tax=Aphanomyces astaci TaxID=112090 RepID=A0A397C2T3_APHAT|nr:hypothetical protein DYB25_011867 [Aphanomyces astaci]RHY38779.1 hypothetical protein DYB30_012714 [Aphanomyces astaci]RHY44894.1 hypothetical protein DYB38_012405 [Aphanomyces astaci]RHY71044.1 hypothetical protein DYB34_012787 [Aphanomyces astaci]RHY96757.1 hypothetical protein DYB31_013449 [Aphanomyces astaci]
MESPRKAAADVGGYHEATTPYDPLAKKEEDIVGGEDDSAIKASDFLAITQGLEYPQVTVKSLVVGTIIGSFLSVLGMYYGLKVGVVPSLNVLAGVGGFMLTNWLLKIKLFHGYFSVQENVVIQTCAVACYSLASQGGFASGVLALTQNVYEDVGEKKGNNASDVVDVTWTKAFGWCISIALFGFFISFPLRRKMIIESRLLFPSGTATAVMIQTLHSSKDAVEYQWNILFKSGIVSYCWSIFVYCFEGLGSFPIFGLEPAKYGWTCDWAPGTFAIAVMLPFRVMSSIFVGCVISFAIMTPYLAAYKGNGDWFTSTKVDGLKAYYTFTAVAVICVDALYSIVKVVIMLYKAWRDSRNAPSAAIDDADDVKSVDVQRQAFLDKLFDATHVPATIWVSGLVLFAAVSVVVISLIFPSVEWWKVLVCCLLIPVFAIGIIQGVGMTDWNISSAVGKLIIFIIGGWSQDGSIIAGLLMCQMVIVGCSQAADLMQDFKTGYLVGASAKSMIIAQIFGAVMSCLIVPSVWVMMTSAYTIPGDVIAAPFGEVYRILGITAIQGLDGLPKHCGLFMLIGAIYTVVFNIFIDVCSESKIKIVRLVANHCPVPMAVAIGMIIPASFGLQGIVVASICAYWNHVNPAQFHKTQYILAAGLMVGDGFSILTQIVITLAGGSAPMHIAYDVAPSH